MLERFEHSNAVEIHNRMFDFYPGLSHNICVDQNVHLTKYQLHINMYWLLPKRGHFGNQNTYFPFSKQMAPHSITLIYDQVIEYLET